MIRALGLVLAVSAALGGCAMSGDEVVVSGSDMRPDLGAVYTAAAADPLRPAEEVARDPLRHPDAMLAFAGLEPGDKVADIRPGAGYFTRLFARVVGEEGKVYAFVPNRTAERENPRADALVAAYPNVVRVNGDLNTMAFPEPLDVVWMSQEYHDVHIPAVNTDVATMNRAIYAALKPGGYFIVVDHSGRPGTGHTEVQTLHRIEGASLRAEVEAAGFVFDGATEVVRNPEDDRSLSVFDESIRGRTDRFVFRFRKPG